MAYTNDYFYKLGVQNKMGSDFLNQLLKTNDSLINSYLQQKNALNKEYDSTVNEYNIQKESKRANALKSGKDAYVNYAKSINPFSGSNSSLARYGLNNSGYNESALINANNNYQTNVGNIETERDNALAEIESAINQVNTKRNSELAGLDREQQNDQYENYYKIRNLWNDEYQRQLEDKYEEASKSRKSNSSGNYSLSEDSDSNNSKNNSKSINYTFNSSPVGLSKKAMSAYNKWITNTVMKDGYVTSNRLNKAISKGLSSGKFTKQEANAILGQAKKYKK